MCVLSALCVCACVKFRSERQPFLAEGKILRDRMVCDRTDHLCPDLSRDRWTGELPRDPLRVLRGLDLECRNGSRSEPFLLHPDQVCQRCHRHRSATTPDPGFHVTHSHLSFPDFPTDLDLGDDRNDHLDLFWKHRRHRDRANHRHFFTCHPGPLRLHKDCVVV